MTATAAPRTPSFSLGRRLTEIALGLDALERTTNRGSGPLDEEGLVPIFIGGDLATAAAFERYADVHAALDALGADCAALDEGARKTFLLGMVRSLDVAARLFAGAAVPFAQKLTALVGVPAQPVPDATVAELHDRLDARLTRRGFTSGTLARRIGAWQTDRYLDPGAIPAIYEELLAEAKARTDARIWPTGEYTMKLRPQRDVPYAGRCSFAQGVMDINLDVRVTRSALKHLVCHEVFPGHATQLLSTRAVASEGQSPLDALLCTANAVTGAVQEGIGDQGIELIDWVEDDDDAVQIDLRRLQTATGTNAAWHLHCSGWTTRESIDYLRDVGFGQESWATVRTMMAAHPFRGPFLASYWFGNETVKALRENPRVERGVLLDALYRGVASVASLRCAVGEVAA